jgi:F-type H+-transporting ATPase subunit gamma
VRYITVGRKGRDLMLRRRKEIVAEFSNLPAGSQLCAMFPPSAGWRWMSSCWAGDEVYLVYTDFVNMVKQIPTMKKLLPLEVTAEEGRVVQDFFFGTRGPAAAYIYEPGQAEILDEIVPRFTACRFTRPSWNRWPASTPPGWWR